MIKLLITALFPQRCDGCGEVINEGEHLCDYCYEMLERCIADKLCIKCGLSKKNCQCKRRIFHYDGCVSPFYKTGVAQKAMYAFKFRGKEIYSKLFSENMALTVKQCYPDVLFDGICYVPMPLKSEIRRGYNQSKALAEGLSKILGIPLYNALYCKNKPYIQHKSSYDSRFKNVRGIYSAVLNVSGKTILLVDDIKTTGATLDECARQLLIAGADRVYCITGLMTDYYKRGKKDGNRNRNRFRHL